MPIHKGHHRAGSIPARILDLLLIEHDGMSHRPIADNLELHPDIVSGAMTDLVASGEVLIYHDMSTRGGGGRGVRIYWHAIHIRRRDAYISAKAQSEPVKPPPAAVVRRPIERLAPGRTEWRDIGGRLIPVHIGPSHQPEAELEALSKANQGATKGLKPGRYIDADTWATRAHISQWGAL